MIGRQSDGAEGRVAQKRSRLRICFVALGQFAHVDPYLDFFDRSGHEVHFVALEPGPDRCVATHNVGRCDGVHRWFGKYRYLPAMVRARKVVRAIKPDLVHAHYATSAGLAARIIDVHPWMVTAHGTDVTLGARSIVWRTLLRTIFQDADCVNPVSPQLRDIILGLGTPAEKLETFTLGVDTQLFRFSERGSNPARQARLICTRRLERVYDYLTILNSMAILRDRGLGLELTIVGGGSQHRCLQETATRLNLNAQVHFAGEIPNPVLPRYLQEHDLYLSASARDGTSLCLLEAMASGLYPVVSDIQANAEWITHGRNGLLHRTGDPYSLAESIASVPRDPARIQETLRFNRDLVVARGDRVTNMKRLEELYYSMCATGKGTRH